MIAKGVASVFIMLPEPKNSMIVTPTRRTFVSGILSVFGFLAGMGRTPPAEASPAPKKEDPVPPPSAVRFDCLESQCATYVYDQRVSLPTSGVTTFVYDYGKLRE